LISGVVGLKPAAPGWKVIEVRPHIDGDLKWARAGIKTVAGSIEASWEKSASGITLKVTIPANASAKISVPVAAGSNTKIYEGDTLIFEGGRAASSVPGLMVMGAEGNYVDLTVGAGTWIFRSE
jgi:alpha-L-rhamnosidase